MAKRRKRSRSRGLGSCPCGSVSGLGSMPPGMGFRVLGHIPLSWILGGLAAAAAFKKVAENPPKPGVVTASRPPVPAVKALPPKPVVPSGFPKSFR